MTTTKQTAAEEFAEQERARIEFEKAKAWGRMMSLTRADIEAALRQERLEIARILNAEAAKLTEAADDLRADYDEGDIEDEAHAYDSEAALLERFADLILARTPVVAADEAPEIAF